MKKWFHKGGRVEWQRVVSLIVSSVSHDLPGMLKTTPLSRGPQEIAGGELGARGV
jgi:hypothetical protein